MPLEAIDWCGGTYSSEWGFSKLLHWLRHNPDKRDAPGNGFEHCDMLTADAMRVHRSRSAPRAASARWVTSGCGIRDLGGLPSEEFLGSRWTRFSPAFGRSCRDVTPRRTRWRAGSRRVWAATLGLRAGIPIPVGAFDAHWDAIGAGVRSGDVVNVVGTSTCIIAVAEQVKLIPGVCGVVQGSAHPQNGRY